MIIDVHAHVGDFRYSLDASRMPLTWADLIARLDEEGIDRAVFLPVYNASPESAPVGIVCGERMSVADQVIDAADYSDRVIPFGNLDPRMGKDFGPALDWFQAHGCRGIGEIMCRLPYDDPRVVTMFRQIGERGMLATIESNVGAPGSAGYGAGFLDDPGSPRLERLLRDAPDAVIIGHGPGFWAEIEYLDSPDTKCAYTVGPIAKEGSIQPLLREYPNLYADLSAYSAFTAITRDPDYGVRFLEEFQDKLLFGTDLISCGTPEQRATQLCAIDRLIDTLITKRRFDQALHNAIDWHHKLMPQLNYLQALAQQERISHDTFEKITGENAARLLLPPASRPPVVGDARAGMVSSCAKQLEMMHDRLPVRCGRQGITGLRKREPMNSRSRMLKAWNFQEPDRVPLEVYLYAPAKGLPGADRILEFQETEADNFRGVAGFDWGFLGLDTTYTEEVIEDVPGAFKRLRRTHTTSAGTFTAITRHDYADGDPNDYHWEKRYIATLDDLRRVAEADRTVRPFNLTSYNAGCATVGTRGLPCTGLFHPLGTLARSSTMDEVYMWLLSEHRIVTRYLEETTAQICATLLSIRDEQLASPPIFMTYALEMLTPPWLGKTHFSKLVFPFDKRVNDAVHCIGGRHRAHCHGNSGEFLELFADMGVDAVEPLEPPPYGDNVLVEAKESVGKRMLLSGNITSQAFYLDSFRVEDVRELVKRAIEEGAPGGGFTLKTTGGAVGNGKTREQCVKSIDCNLALIDAWREFGCYH